MPRPRRVDRAFARFCRTGDPKSLGKVFDATAAELLKVAGYVLGERDRARDVVQSAFLVAIEKRAEFDTSRSVMPWLCGIVANLARAEKRRLRPVGDPVATEDATTPLAAAERAEFRAALARARTEVPEPYRPVLDLYLEHGLAAADIARVLERPPGTVRTQIVRGLEALREKLPRGFAMGLAVAAVGPSTLAAMRTTVVARAAELVGMPAATAAVGVGAAFVGGTIMEKSSRVAIVAAIVLLATATWFGVRTLGSDPDPDTPPGTVETARIPTDDPEGTADVPDAAERRAVEASVDPTDEIGTGGVDIVVRWKSTGEPAPRQDVQVVSYADPFRELRPRRALTDADGRVALRDIPSGLASVQIATGERRDVTIVPGVVLEQEFEAEHRVTVKGLVVDNRGVPVPDADIWISSEFRYHRLQRDYGPGHGQYGSFVMQSDASGRFELRADFMQCVAAYKRGHAPSESFYVANGHRDGEPRELTLKLGPAGGELRVVVRDDGGRPIEGAHVVIGHETPHMTGTSDDAATSPALRGTTDTDGTCVVDRLPTGRLPLQVRAPGFAPFRERIELAAGVVTHHDVTLTPGATVAGTVRNDDGEPVSGAVVHYGQTSSLEGSLAESDANGRFELTELPAGDRRIVAWKRDVGELDTTLPLVAGETYTWDPVLSVRPAITGVVLDQHGKPVERAEVNTWSVGGSGSSHASDVTDERGRFLLGPLKRDRTYNVRVGYVSASGGTVELRASEVVPETEIELRASADDEPNSGIRGRIVMAGGRSLDRMQLLMFENNAGLQLQVAADGTFTSRPRKPGTVRLAAHAVSGMRTLAEFGSFTLRPHEVLDVGTLEVPEPGSIVLAPASGDLAGFTCWLYLDGRYLDGRRLTTDNLRWDELPPGSYVLSVMRGGDAPRIATERFEVHSGQTAHVAVGVREARRVTLSFALADDRKEWFEITARDADGRLGFRGSTNDRVQDGSTHRLLMPHGAWTLEFRDKSGVVATAEVPAAVDGAVTVRIPAR